MWTFSLSDEMRLDRMIVIVSGGPRDHGPNLPWWNGSSLP